MPPGRLEVFQACPIARRPRGRTITRWRDYKSHLAWEHLRIPQEELESVSGEKIIWGALLSLLPPRPQVVGPRIRGREWTDGWMKMQTFLKLLNHHLKEVLNQSGAVTNFLKVVA